MVRLGPFAVDFAAEYGAQAVGHYDGGKVDVSHEHEDHEQCRDVVYGVDEFLACKVGVFVEGHVDAGKGEYAHGGHHEPEEYLLTGVEFAGGRCPLTPPR